jgi:hypothetical protein
MNNIGGFNRLSYDNCAYQKRLYESTGPLNYMLYQGKFENCGKCLHDKFYTPQHPSIVDIENELLNIKKPASECDQFKHGPQCVATGLCRSTFDKNAPVVFPAEVCPIVHNNIPRVTDPGYNLPDPNICGGQ